MCLSCPTHPLNCVVCAESGSHKGHVQIAAPHLGNLMRQHLLRSASLASTRLHALPAFEIDISTLDAAPTAAVEVSTDAEPLSVIELRQMASNIAHEIELVAGNATSAHNTVNELKERAVASATVADADHAVQEACAAIVAQIDEVEATKVSKLEADAVHVDELLLVRGARLDHYTH